MHPAFNRLLKLLLIFWVTLSAQAEETVPILMQSKDIQFEIPKGWYRYQNPEGIQLSRDGILLQRVSLSRYTYGQKLPNSNQVLSKDMSLTQKAEALSQSLEMAPSISQFNQDRLQPIQIDGLDGIVMDVRSQVADDSPLKSSIYLFFTDKWIYQISYTGTQQVYYERGLEGFHQVINSLKILDR